MSAVVHTGSREARSACGTKVIVFADSAPTMRGAANAVAPAKADLRKVRRFINVFLGRVLSLLARPTRAGNREATKPDAPGFVCTERRSGPIVSGARLAA